MRTLLKILAVLASLGIVALVLAVYFTSGLSDTADSFFKAIRSKKYQEAYSFLSSDFKASASYDDFVAFLNRNALLTYRDASWSSRSASGNKGELDGTITTETGGIIPLKLSLVKEDGAWKIYAIQKVKSGILSDESLGMTPSGPEQVALVRRSMRMFAEAVMAKDFSDFHRHVSQLWQRQITAEQFNHVFKGFIDADLDLLFLDNHMPVFEESPEVDQNGVLTIKGYYPTKPSRVIFEYGYIREGTDWKLIKTNINIKPIE